MKKLLISLIAVTIAVSPLVPRLFADSGSWESTQAEAAWDYDYFAVERLALEDGVRGPFSFADTVFLTKDSIACEFDYACDLVDLTIVNNGQTIEVTGVSDSIEDPFWHMAQDGRFLFRVPSEDENTWGDVYEYDAATGSISVLTSLERTETGVDFMTFATEGDRIYTSTLQTEEGTGDVEAQLSMVDLATGFERDDFTYQLTAPWQEIVDVHDGLALVRFQFEGDFEQLWLVNQTERSMESIPDTWTESGADIVAPHFMADGTVRFFRNFRLFTYMPGVDETPVQSGGAFLNWFEGAQDVVQIAGNRIAWIDAENGLYISDEDGVRKFGVALSANYTLTEDALYFQNLSGEYQCYTFEDGTWETRAYQVTDSADDVLVGIDAAGDVWYENRSNGYLLNIGYGSTPYLTDREHAYWQGADGNVYQVTFSSLIDLERPEVEAFKAYNAAGVYLVSGDQMWLVPDEQVFYTWFTSFDQVVPVSQATIDVYLDYYAFEGNLKFAPGTRVKATDSSRVYMMGTDYKLHWIASETVAKDVFGSNWNQGIVEVNPTYLWKYSKGDTLTSADQVRSI